jgi:hypothetical protein
VQFLNGQQPPYDLTYDDVFLVPTRSSVESRFDVVHRADYGGTLLQFVLADIGMRAITGSSLVWVGEVSRVMLVWSVFLGVGAAIEILGKAPVGIDRVVFKPVPDDTSRVAGLTTGEVSPGSLGDIGEISNGIRTETETVSSRSRSSSSGF